MINAELCKRQPDYTNIKNRMRRTLFKSVDLMTKSTREVMDMFPFLGLPQLEYLFLVLFPLSLVFPLHFQFSMDFFI